MDTRPIRSMTIRQLLTPHANVPTETVMLMGTLKFLPDVFPSWSFELNDSTGRLRVLRICVTTRVVNDVNERLQQESNPGEVVHDVGIPPWEDGKYHHIVGVMTGGVFEAVEIRAVHDMNELTVHMLQCVYQHLRKH
jgi:hypothetical protein